MIYIVAVRVQSPGTRPEHILEVIWADADDFESGRATVASIIDWITKGGIAKVTDGKVVADVEVVRPTGRPPYIKTKGDKSTLDNLLALPKFM